MNKLLQKSLLQPGAVTIHLKRYRGKINIQKPREPHYEKALFNAITKPYIPKPTITELCHNNLLDTKQRKNQKIQNPYNQTIGREFLNWLNHSKLVGIFHLNSITQEEMFKITVAFFKHNMHLKQYGIKIIKEAITDTKYESIMPLVEGNSCFVFSPDVPITRLLAITKKSPQLIILAGIAENRLLSKSQLLEYASLTDLQTVRGQFVNVLNSIGSGVAQQLETHQQQFVSLLDIHAANTTPVPVDTPVTVDTNAEADQTPTNKT